MNGIENFKGIWKTEHGQIINIRHIPLLGSIVASYKPCAGKKKWMLTCSFQDEMLYVGLSPLHWLEAMLILTLANDINTKEIILVPTLECGPESDWMEEGFDFLWVLPLEVFRRV